MIQKSLNYINILTNKKERFLIKIYFLGFIFLSLLETIGIGLVPGLFSAILDKNLILEKLKYSDFLYSKANQILDNENIIIYFASLIFIFFFFKFIFNLFFYFYEAKTFNNLKVKISSSLFESYLAKKYLFHATNNPIILGRNITSEVNASVAYIKSFILIMKEIIQIFLILLLLMFANYKITILIFLVLLILSLVYLKLFSQILKKKVKVSFFERGEKSKIVNQILNAIIEVKLYKKSKYFIEKFTSSIEREFQSNKFLEVINKIPRISIELIIVFVVCLSMVIALLTKINIQSIIPIIALYFFAALRIYPSLNNILQCRMGLINGEISISQVSEAFNSLHDDIEETTENKNAFSFQEKLKIVNLNFKYPMRKITLDNLNFEIKKNEIVGIIGTTGSGKSTLIKIIMGLIQPDSGQIIIDSKELKTYKNQWQKRIGYVPQNFYILDDTILENITFGEKKEINDLNKIEKILKQTSLDKFINSLPKKLDTLVGSNAKQISGGQAQRIALARALYRDPEIIILDEATSSLDAKTENEIIEYIYSLKNDKTIIIVSHNEEILNKCDKIYQIDNGKLSIKN